MKILSTVRDAQVFALNNQNLVLVPTMGALHAGHLSLVKLAKATGLKVVVSIFVNPKQFNNPADLEKYPRVLEQDLELLKPYSVDAIFSPSSEDLYQSNFQTTIQPGPLAAAFEGSDRPGHFSGVCTVCSILFNIFRPQQAVFGEKDFQQLRIIEQLCQDLKLPINIVRAPIIREEHGLAMSSRNERLNPDDRLAAKIIFESLQLAKSLYESGEKDPRVIQAKAMNLLNQNPIKRVYYWQIVDEVNFSTINQVVPNSRILTAVDVSGVRLLDNAKL